MTSSFTLTEDWQDVPEDAVLPPGCDIQIDMTTGAKRARLMPNGAAPASPMPAPAPPGGKSKASASVGTPGKPAAKQTAPADWEKRLSAAIDEMNLIHFVVTLAGQTVIATSTQDDALGRELLVFSQERDIRLRYRHRQYMTGYTEKGIEVWKGLGDIWLGHSRRRTFDRIALLPGGTVPKGVYNMWRGFGVEPKRGKWPLIREHLVQVICSGNRDDAHWLLRWMARSVQSPEKPAEVAVVLRGPKGSGKGTLGQIMTKLFRQHALQISNPAHLTGRFNGHLVDVLFLFVDEALWAGDKPGESTLKGLITEPTIPIEPKFVTLFQAINRLKILMASNADWVVPATHDERRYFVLDVPDARCGDRQYFAQLYQALNGPELPAFLDYLLKLDLTDFDFRNPPHTAGLNAQKLAGGDSVIKFWLDCLTSGEIVGVDCAGVTVPDPDAGSWPEDVVAQVLHAAYVDHAHAHGDRRPLTDCHMAQKLAELMPDRTLRSLRSRVAYGDTKRPTRYVLPILDDCRDTFLQAMRIDDHPWPEE